MCEQHLWRGRPNVYVEKVMYPREQIGTAITECDMLVADDYMPRLRLWWHGAMIGDMYEEQGETYLIGHYDDIDALPRWQILLINHQVYLLHNQA